jgi:predicted signal transduction protein with EAL and GGDEF domain
MGRSLKLRVIAEGVETPEQCAFLLARHCDEGQGNYSSRPVGAERSPPYFKPVFHPVFTADVQTYASGLMNTRTQGAPAAICRIPMRAEIYYSRARLAGKTLRRH